ncbi:MAG TPA: hypothetical protein VK504_06110 [Vicinamibacterales bacterium]|nr:hypothetical protein [Vicinamibacterales bacterium]
MPLLLDGPSAALAEGRLYNARAIVTAPVIFSTAAGTGGPLLWNGSPKTVARILKFGYAVTVASTVAGALGFTGGIQGGTAPSSTTAIDSFNNLSIGSTNPSQMNWYRVGTPAAAGAWFLPIVEVTTVALTAFGDVTTWVDLDGTLLVPPKAWLSIAGSATLSTLVGQFSIVYEEMNQP